MADRLRGLWDFGDLDTTERRLREQLAREADDAGRAEVLTQLARVEGLRGDVDAGERSIEEAAARAGKDVTARARIDLERGRLRRSSGDPEAALPLFASAFETSLGSGRSFIAADAAHMAALAAPDRSGFLAWTERGIELAEADDGARYWLGPLLNNLGWERYEHGEYEAALDAFERALRARERDASDREAIEIARYGVGKALRALGRSRKPCRSSSTRWPGRSARGRRTAGSTRSSRRSTRLSVARTRPGNRRGSPCRCSWRPTRRSPGRRSCCAAALARRRLSAGASIRARRSRGIHLVARKLTMAWVLGMAELTTIQTMRQPVTTTYHGVDVTEDYRWLEDASSEDTKTWTKAQHERTMSYLSSLPSYAEIRRRAEEIVGADSVSYRGLEAGGATAFALKRQPPKQQAFLVALAEVMDASTERVIVDPNVLDPSGATTIDWFVPSPDGRLVAVSLSSHGTEDGTLHVFDASTGELVDVRIPRVTLMGGSLAWRGDSGAFWYTRYPAPGERAEEDLRFYQEVWFHEIGGNEDRQDLAGVFADDRIVENLLSSSPDGRWVLDRAARGDGGEWEVFVRPQAGGDWWMVAAIADQIVDAALQT